ncbi:ion channel [uncultured Christiangramia sp.]
MIEDIGSGFWWAGVTMITIVYGDKAPVTFWGRAIALF